MTGTRQSQGTSSFSTEKYKVINKNLIKGNGVIYCLVNYMDGFQVFVPFRTSFFPAEDFLNGN